tara:strand:- start:1532 stop:2398 length:867 start_codon:yes stop_codon:yes gene_type:complete
MAKKQTKKVEVKEPYVEETVVIEEPTVVEAPKPEPKPTRKEPSFKKAEDGWEIKNRTYFLKNRLKPLSYMIKSANIYYFDEEKGYERELKYCSNQKTTFVDEMKGDQRLEHIVFRGGTLLVEKEKVVLQKLLSLYHPHRNKLFQEHIPEIIAENQMDILELEVDALLAARNLDIETAEAVMRVEYGSNVSNMSSKELKRDLLIYAKRNPGLFLELVNDDNVVLRNFGIKATEIGVIQLSNDQRTFTWGSNGRKLMTVPFDEHPYSALAHWFKTDEGMEIYKNIEKRLK